MRLLRLDLGGQSGSLNLHPFLTVMQRRGVDDRQPVIRAARSLANGDGSGVFGLVETHQGLVELEGATSPELRCPVTTEDIVIDTDAAAGGDAAPSSLQAELDQLQRRATIDAVAVEMIRADLDPAAAARLQHLRSYLAGDSEGMMDPRVVAKLNAVGHALSTVMEQPPTLIESAAGMDDLIEQWRVYDNKRRTHASHLAKLEARIEDAAAAVEAAESALAAAQADAKPIVLSPDDEKRLDELANPIVERRGKKRPRDRTPAEDAELEKLLAKVGVPTYTAYAMHRLNPQAPPDKQAALHAAGAALARCQAELEEARALRSLDPVIRELEYERAAVIEAAKPHLGEVLPEDLGSALETHVIERENPLWIEGLKKLYDALGSVGAGIPQNMEPADLCQWAEEWIEITERAACEKAGIAPADVEDQIAAAETALERHARAMARIDQMEAAAEQTARSVQQLQLQIARSEQSVRATAAETLDNLLPHLERINASAGTSSVPVVLTGRFGQLSDEDVEDLLFSLEAFTEHFQLIVVTDRARALSWATEVGLERASSV